MNSKMVFQFLRSFKFCLPRRQNYCIHFCILFYCSSFSSCFLQFAMKIQKFFKCIICQVYRISMLPVNSILNDIVIFLEGMQHIDILLISPIISFVPRKLINSYLSTSSIIFYGATECLGDLKIHYLKPAYTEIY